MSDAQSLTRYVAEFAVGTRYEHIPEEVVRLGKKSMLEALGVGLSGAISAPGRAMQDYIKDFAAR